MAYSLVNFYRFRKPSALTVAGHRGVKMLRMHRWAWLALTVGVASILLGYRLGANPIDLWDESRLANNALEMAHSGLSLVTTFDGAPDHWNTKPPLLIWLMSMSIRVFGPHEWAVRLPSVAAAFGTCLIMFFFFARHLRKPALGFASVMLLFLSHGYMTRHGARSGDYEALLTLLTTGYLLAAYLSLHGKEEHRQRWFAACAAGVTLAFLTKTIQGMIFLPALLLYAGFKPHFWRMARSRTGVVSTAIVLLVCCGYYFARESVDPGYIAAAINNDLLGRFNTVLDEHAGGPWWYVMQVERCVWLLPGLAGAVWLARRAQGAARQLGTYLGSVCAFYLLVISLSKTKLPWYPIPLYPLLAMLVALCMERLVRLAIRQQDGASARARRRLVWIYGSLGATALAVNIAMVRVANSRIPELHHYSIFLRASGIPDTHTGRIVVLHPGYPSSHYDYYTAPTLFYVNRLRQEGHSIVIQRPSEPIPAGYDSAVLCGSVREAMAASRRLKVITANADCGLYALGE